MNHGLGMAVPSEYKAPGRVKVGTGQTPSFLYCPYAKHAGRQVQGLARGNGAQSLTSLQKRR
jgi:hypothetical protein